MNFSNKSDEDLSAIIANADINPRMVVTAAKQELKARGIKLPDEGENDTSSYVGETETNAPVSAETVIPAESRPDDFSNPFKPNWKKNIVTDPAAPELYSRRVLYIFSILFSTTFAGIMMAMNVGRVNKPEKAVTVLSFSFGYTILIIVIANLLPRSPTFDYGFILNTIGSIFLTNKFWKQYIGEETAYRTRSWTIPLVIGIALSILMIASVVYDAGNN